MHPTAIWPIGEKRFSSLMPQLGNTNGCQGDRYHGNQKHLYLFSPGRFGDGTSNRFSPYFPCIVILKKEQTA